MRLLLLYILPLLFPAAVYLTWVRLRRSGVKDGEEPKKDPWFWLILGGLAFVALAFVLTALVDDKVTDGTYHPDRIENGKIVPGKIKSSPR